MSKSNQNQPAKPTVPVVDGIGGLAERFGVHRNTASSWTKRRDFPEPIFKLSGINGYALSEVKTWVKDWLKTNKHPSRNQLNLQEKGKSK
jgi:predicted DNA-binding transcriptional regulator AlpA